MESKLGQLRIAPMGPQRLERILQMSFLLQSGIFLTARQLAEKYGICRRTVFRDIRTLQGAGFPVEFDAAKRGYQARQSARWAAPFSNDEVLSLLLSISGAGVTTRRLSQALPQAIAKLLQQPRPNFRKEAANVLRACQMPLPPPGSMAGWQEEIFEQVLEAVRQDKPIRIHYQESQRGPRFVTKLRPRVFAPSNGTWVLAGRSSRHRGNKSIPIEQIHKAEVLSDDCLALVPGSRR